MTIDIKCYKKSLIKDFFILGCTAAVIVAIAAFLWATVTYSAHIASAWSFFTSPFTAVNVFIIVEFIVMAVSLFISITATKEDVKNKDETIFRFFISSACLVVVFGIYCFISALQLDKFPWFPDVIPILGGYLILNVILTPFAVGYARCKE